MFNTQEIKSLYEMFKGTDIGEVEIKNDNVKLKLSLSQIANITSTSVATPDLVNAVHPADSPVSTESTESANELRSRWVGFFTRLNPKTKEYYIKMRDQVKVGDILGHVRVLGVLQDVKAEIDGKVKEILIEEGQPIEYGQPLMRFEA